MSGSDRHLLLTCPQLQPLAEAILASDSSIELGSINWNHFPDGFPNLFIENIDTIQQSHVAFLASLDTPDTIFEQVSVIYALANARPRSLKILLPYFPTGTMERISEEGAIATASTLAQMLSALAPSGPGPVPLYLWDIHALQIRHYFGPTIAPRFKSAIPLLVDRLCDRNVSIAFPDEGACKRFQHLFDPTTPFIICHKVRLGDKRVVTIREGDVANRDIVIVDDLIHSGNTILECQKALLAAGARTVSAYATHGIFEKDAWRNFINAGFDRIWTTDSHPMAQTIKQHQPFEILSLAEQMARAIRE